MCPILVLFDLTIDALPLVSFGDFLKNLPDRAACAHSVLIHTFSFLIAVEFVSRHVDAGVD